MNDTGRDINEDPSLALRKIPAVTAIVIFLVIALGMATGDREVIWLSVGVSVLATIFVAGAMRRTRRKLATRQGTWQLTAEGLQRVYVEGEHDTILWQELQYMHWTPNKGLIIRWKDTSPRGEQFEREFSGRYVEGRGHAELLVGNSEAAKLVAIWRDKSSAQPHSKPDTFHSNRPTLGPGIFPQIVGIALIVWGSSRIIRQYPSCNWPFTEGRIMSQLYVQLPVDIKHHGRKAQLDLRYSYVVAGKTNYSGQFNLRNYRYQDEDANVRFYAEQHPRGAPVTVYYKPGNPQEAVLQPGPDWRGDFSLIFGGALLVGAGILVNMVSVRAAQARTRARLGST